MLRIDTPTAQPDKFGVGKDGAWDDGNLNGPSQIGSNIVNSMQEEIAAVIEGNSMVLDPGNLHQMREALDNFVFGGDAIIDAGATLTVKSAGAIVVESGGLIVALSGGNQQMLLGSTMELSGTTTVMSGGNLQMLVGSIVDISGTTTITSTATFSCDTNASFTKDVFIGDDAADALIVTATSTFQSPAFVNDNWEFAGSKVLSGLAGSSVEFPTFDTGTTGRLLSSLTQWYTDASPATDLGHEQFDGFRKSLGDGTSDQPILAPFQAYVPQNVANVVLIDIVGLAVTLEIPPTRSVTIELFVNQSVNTAPQRPKIEIRAQNAGAVDVVALLKAAALDPATSQLPATVTNGDARPNSIVIDWRPDDDVPAPANNTWTIQAEHGVTGGAIVTTQNAKLRVTYN